MSSNKNPKSTQSSQKQSKPKSPVENNPFCLKRDVSYALHNLIREKGFKKESHVYNAAEIQKNTWCRIYSGLARPNEVNARKLVIGLRLTLEEATKFMSLCGYSFTPCPVDACIISCLKSGAVHTWAEVLSYVEAHCPKLLDYRYKKLLAA